MENQSAIDYSIDKLPGIFADHARMANRMHQDQFEKFVEANPGAPLPDHLRYPFNIALALSIMSQAILDLQSKS